MAENDPHSIKNPYKEPSIESKNHQNHPPYKEEENPKHKDYQGFIKSMEDAREKLHSYRGSKLYKEEDAIRLAIDALYRHIQTETGYRMGWFIDEIDRYLEKMGRPTTYDYDDKLLGCQFIHMLIQYGSSKAQAISLLSILIGNRIVTEGFKKEFGDSYKEFSNNLSNKITPLETAKIITNFSAIASLETLDQSTELQKDSLPALKKACQETIDYMRKFRELVSKKDRSHKEYHATAINIMDRTEENPIAYFFSRTMDKDDDSELLNRRKIKMELTDYLDAIDSFTEKP